MNKASINKQTIKFFWDTAMREKSTFFLSLLFPFGQICMATLAPLFTGKIIASLSTPSADHLHYLPHLCVAAVAGVISNRIGLVNLYKNQAEGIKHVQDVAVTTLLRRSVGFHSNNIGGKLVSDAADYGQSYSQLSNAVFFTLIPFATLLFFGSMLVFVESIWLGIIITITALFALCAGAYDSHNRAPLRKRRLAASKALIGHMADTIVNVQNVKTFAREDDELGRHRKLATTLADIRANDLALAAKKGNTRIATLLILQLIFVLTLVHLVQTTPALLGIGIFAFSFTTTIFTRLFDSFAVIRQIEEALLQASPMTQIMQTMPEILDAAEAKDLQVAKGHLVLNNVAFTYEEKKQHSVFKRLSLDIAPGERVGLVGPSGGGKSTLTRLLLRFDDIDDGTITIDDQDISQVTQASLRRAISYVPQEPLLFHRSVKENIAYGMPDATDEQIVSASKKAYAHDFIAELAEGYETVVGERGVKLSGGQRQRIAIARAILKNAPILVLDEATSALDSESEVEIQKALWELMKSRTALVIAHRLSTIQKMDRIIVLDGGKLVEQGTHQQLIKQKGLYAKLWAHQSGGFIEE